MRTPFENWNLMKGIGEGLNTKSLPMSSLFAFEMIFNSTTWNCISNSLACLIFSLSSNYFLSCSSFASLRLSSFAFSSSSLFFFSFISFSPCSLLAQSFSSFSFHTLEAFYVWLALSFLCFSLFVCSLKSKSKLCLKSFSSLENIAMFWMNASPMSMKSSILACCSLVILNEGGMKCFHMHVFNS